MRNSPIGVFDSGVGGLTILSELQKLLPHESFIYIADQAHAPYGTKSKSYVEKRALIITRFLKEKRVKMVIVACNTATIASVSSLRQTFHFPIIGVVPVVKTAAEETTTNKIAVFATPSTINSPYLNLLIDKFAQGMTVYKNGVTGLESLIESGDISSSKIKKILHEQLLPLKNMGVDVIALGCTHYPFLKKQIKEAVGENILILDSGGAVARHAKRILERNTITANEKNVQNWYYTTGDSKKFNKTARKLLKKTVQSDHIDL